MVRLAWEPNSKDLCTIKKPLFWHPDLVPSVLITDHLDQSDDHAERSHCEDSHSFDGGSIMSVDEDGPALPLSAHTPYAPGPGNPPPSSPVEPSSTASSSIAPSNPPNTGQFPDGLDPLSVSPDMKKEGSDWFAVFNPKVKRVLDVSLVHTLMHERCVPLEF